MAIDQNSVPKDPVHLNPNRCLFTASSSSPYPPSSCSTAGDSPAADESADDQPSARKVKLLCSFGGKILPRPSDGALRYAGGQTRIIAVRRDTTFPELCRKMKDAYGAPVAIRYQLPDEDLDALVSVSSAEDLDNMMDEYDKLAEVSGDGSAKLRVFLFSQAEIASVLADNLSVGPARSDPYEGGQKYVEAVNGGSASDAGIYACEIRRKGSMASASSTQNSDGGFDGSNNDGASSAIASPAAGASAAFDPSTLTFAGTATSGTLPESQGFPASSTFFGQAMVTTQSLNPPHAPPYTSQAFVEPHQVHYMPPLSLNMAAAPRMVNVVSVPQHTYPSFLPTTPSSMPAQVGTVKTVKGKVDPFSEEDQLSGRFVQPMSDHSYNVFQQPLSQIPPLQPSHLPPPSIEPYGLHLVPPLSKVPLLIFEDCQMCQKSLPHVHSDRLVNEPGDRPIVHSYHSQDIARMQGQHRSVTAAMMENSVEPKFEHSVNPCQYGNYGANKVPDLALDREQLFGATAEKIDHSKLRHPLGAVGLSGDAQESYGVFVSSAQSHLEGSFQQQKKQVLHGENFHAAKVLRPTDTLTLSSGINASNVASLSPPQTQRCDALQQQNVLLAEGADPIQVFHPSGAIGLSSTVQPSYGVFQSPPQPHHDESLQQQQLPAETATAFFPAKQALISKQGGKDSFSMNNVRYNVLEPPSLAQDYVEQVDGVMEALNLSTFDTLRSSDLLKPTLVPNVGAQDMKLENLYAVRDNHAFRLPNDANALLSSNGFITSAVGPDGMYIKPANPVVLNTSISREIRPESPSVIVEDNNTVKSHHGASKLPSSNAFISTGRLPMETSMGRINPLLSNMMELHTSELANASQASTIFGSSMLRAQNFERGAKPLTDSQRIPGMSPYIIDPAYSNTVAEGTSKAWEDEVSQAQAQNLFDGMAASQRGNAPFPLSSLLVPGEVGQFRETFLPGSLLGNEDPQEILESMNACRPRTAIVATRGPTISGDNSCENRLPMGQSPDIAVLLEEGALQPPADWLIRESRPDPVVGTKDTGADYIDQDLHDLAEQVVESVLESSTPPLSVQSFNGSKEMNPPFLRESGLSEDNSNSQSASVPGDQRIENIKARQSDKLHMGFLMANDIGRLQIIKNSDLEELRELGSGTFGTVYHGKWRGSDVAIKRINDRCFAGKPSEQEKMRADFWNEASKLADLHHPNVVAFYGVVIDGPGGSFATVTEYMVNGSLRNVLQRDDTTLDRRKCLLIAMDVAFGMEYLHGKNIVHFDLKSDNLLVNLRDPQRPICKVGDLGLSKVKCKTLISGGVRGTLPWMAPELLNGSSNLVSEKVDVFSFGIVMWELLTGEEPYSDLHYGAIIGGIVSNTLRPTVPDSCDPEWGALMERCWSAEPTDRPSFTEIANRLRSMEALLPQKGQAQK
ncbi:uncharacterized protein LOC110096990 isoform X4 [Dendrobium catenatum]|uniref:uncharacterized protein LOC110096990 isoform X4 n=1 Tax=Dendrobium catenatum TaxID=906689 RepID=UPI00109FEA93|nr:uncharacterized protein LOC110096990 isoform X4 [Dendrobium catenatum]